MCSSDLQDAQAGDWHCMAITRDSMGNFSLIENNVVKNTVQSNNTPIGNSSGYVIASRWDATTDWAHITTGVVAVYNRALTSQELTQNWEFVRACYGL